VGGRVRQVEVKGWRLQNGGSDQPPLPGPEVHCPIVVAVEDPQCLSP